jgi:hypothetical protein
MNWQSGIVHYDRLFPCKYNDKLLRVYQGTGHIALIAGLILLCLQHSYQMAK